MLARLQVSIGPTEMKLVDNLSLCPAISSNVSELPGRIAISSGQLSLAVSGSYPTRSCMCFVYSRSYPYNSPYILHDGASDGFLVRRRRTRSRVCVLYICGTGGLTVNCQRLQSLIRNRPGNLCLLIRQRSRMHASTLFASCHPTLSVFLA